MKFKHFINTIDYHHGQANRTIISGYPPILGKTMKEKSEYYDEHLAWIHRNLIREPRGHANMLGSLSYLFYYFSILNFFAFFKVNPES